jgi:hypothetical protein
MSTTNIVIEPSLSIRCKKNKHWAHKTDPNKNTNEKTTKVLQKRRMMKSSFPSGLYGESVNRINVKNLNLWFFLLFNTISNQTTFKSTTRSSL